MSRSNFNAAKHALILQSDSYELQNIIRDSRMYSRYVVFRLCMREIELDMTLRWFLWHLYFSCNKVLSVHGYEQLAPSGWDLLFSCRVYNDEYVAIWQACSLSIQSRVLVVGISLTLYKNIFVGCVRHSINMCLFVASRHGSRAGKSRFCLRASTSFASVLHVSCILVSLHNKTYLLDRRHYT